ncbi:glycosyltransferase [Agrobacterium larrymoorei]|uniref:CDP-glycerol glycerophosphotransferase family protein n=1 Tax=Agrobacterium larrymoorei TaxID=160699 RepID=UPI0015738AA4|nr:CDP-glycerol glycerophosphotransferase family protein [Agrobacterium larrymoorei]NTJ43575.1 glycosyltransferase [Agrobacterium larrymoorei]
MKMVRNYLSQKIDKVFDRIEGAIVARGKKIPWRKSLSADHKFTVVSAVYNMGPYLNDYFVSLTRQVIDFRSNIHIVIVDDGSTDNSYSICCRWKEAYPENITIVRQRNAGQAAARNRGLRHATGEWITFIDPDDFVSRRYFLAADRLLRTRRRRPLALLAPKLLMYYEKSGNVIDNHTLTYRFREGTVVVPISNPGKYMQLSAATAFFRRDIIKRGHLKFDPRIRPAFEDAHFVGRYLLESGDMDMCFTDKGIYYYRKRETQTSTIDTAWTKKERFDEQIRYGSIGLLDYAKSKLGETPFWIQRMVLYDLSWHFRRVTNNPSATSFLSTHEKQRYFTLLRQAFSAISVSNIVSFELAGIWSFHKIGICSLLKSSGTDFNNFYSEEYDQDSGCLRFRYFSRLKDTTFSVFLDGVQGDILHRKTVAHKFLDHDFVYETIFWVHVEGVTSARVCVDGSFAPVFVKGVRHDVVPVKKAIGVLCNIEITAKLKFLSRVKKWHAKRSQVREYFNDAWLIADREDRADDNGEHFYRYLKGRSDAPNIYFLLRKSSPDWLRLENEGFKLLEFGSWRHHLAVLNCKYIISSHSGRHIRLPLPLSKYKDLIRSKFIFLQHGIILHDVSSAINAVQPRLLITSTVGEFHSIAGDLSTYKLSTRETKLTGLARHDALLARRVHNPSTILVMPTWRTSLLAKSVAGTSVREPLESFSKSNYALRWKAYLKSKKLRQMAEKHSCEIVFVLHFMFDAYKSFFENIPGVKVLSQNESIDLQSLFGQSKVMITDYSSVAFEAAYIDRDVIYYQFDKDEFFGDGHGYKVGYFDYETDGFGPVATTHDDLLKHTSRALTGLSDKKYAVRREKTFPHRDGENCARIFAAIKHLDNVPDQFSSERGMGVQFLSVSKDDRGFEDAGETPIKLAS